MELTGKIIEREATQIISDRMSKRVIVIETDGGEDGKYKQYIPIEFINKSIEKIEGFPVGSHVIVSIEIRGRKWQKSDMPKPKYFTSISGWRISSSNAGGDSHPAPSGGGGGGGRVGGFAGPTNNPDEDIPFGPIFEV